MLALLDVIEKKACIFDEESFKTRVVRSMEMAYCAMRSPFVTPGERSDFGVLCISTDLHRWQTVRPPL